MSTTESIVNQSKLEATEPPRLVSEEREWGGEGGARG